MVKFDMPPATIDKDTFNFLYQIVEKLNILSDTIGETETSTTSELSATTASSEQQSGYNELKSLIIKTADSFTKTITEVENTMTEDYCAISDFGTYVQSLSSQIETDPSSVTTYYSFVSSLNSAINELQQYNIDTKSYIRSGIVYYDDSGVPITGIAIGQNLTEQEGLITSTFRAVFTAQELSFWRGDNKVAYVSNDMLYINKAKVLDSMEINNWSISPKNGLAIKWVGGNT